MDHQTFQSWEEMQQLALPPNATLLVPPPPEPVDMAALSAGPPPTQRDWLDDAFYKDGTPRSADPEAERAAAERAQYGPGPVRLLANMIAVNALLQYAQSPPKNDDEAKRRLPAEPKPETE